MSATTIVADIVLDAIDVVGTRRKVDPAWVEAIAGSFAERGQLAPIDLVQLGDRFGLVAGGHRLAAARKLGWNTIAAFVKDPATYANEAELVLREVEENLIRRQLSVLDKAVEIVRWRDAYNAANLTRKAGRPAKKTSQNATIPADEEISAKLALIFSEAAQQALGVSRRALFRLVQIAGIATEVRDRIALHPIADNQSELLQLAALTPARQADVAALLTAEPPQATSVADAITILDRVPTQAPEPRWQKVSSAFSSMKTADQHAFFAAHEETIRAWLAGRPA